MPPDLLEEPSVEIATLFGLPAHPLIVHSVVVLVPLVALGAIAVALSPALRARYGSLVAVGAILDVALVPLAAGTGERLQDKVAGSALVTAHAEMGEQLLPFVVAIAVALAFFALRPRLLARRAGTTTSPTSPTSPAWAAPWVATLMVGVALLGAAGSLVQVARIGHSGAKAAWANVAATGK